MIINLRRLSLPLGLLLLLLFFSGALFSQEIIEEPPSDTPPSETPSPDQGNSDDHYAFNSIVLHSLGDKFFAIKAGVDIPTASTDISGYGPLETKSLIGQILPLLYAEISGGFYVSNHFRVSMTIGGMYGVDKNGDFFSPDERTYYSIPILFDAFYNVYFEPWIPVYLSLGVSTGIDMEWYLESFFNVDYIIKLTAEIMWDFSETVDMGVGVSYWQDYQFPLSTPSKFRLGQFESVTLIFRYNFQ